MLAYFVFLFVLLVVCCGLVLWRAKRRSVLRLRRKRTKERTEGVRRTQAKPPWVKREVVRFKALMPDDGCRTIAAVFNRVHGKSGITVGKTFVNTAIREHRYEIMALRRQIKHRKPPITPKNLIWQVDLTGKRSEENPRQSLVGVIDHGTRACVTLAALPRKTTIRILITLLEAMEQFGVPRAIRTDNEAVFTSRWFRIGLWLLGVRHQRIEMQCPWQNGRIERMFLTLKQSLDRLEFSDMDTLDRHLITWRFWYNHVRPHQHLDGRAPAEVWNGAALSPKKKKPTWFEDETGLLRGVYVPN